MIAGMAGNDLIFTGAEIMRVYEKRKGKHMMVEKLGIFVLAAVIVGGAAFFIKKLGWLRALLQRFTGQRKSENGGSSQGQKEDLEEQRRLEERKRLEKQRRLEQEKLAEEYCRVLQETENKKSEEAYKKLFLRYGNLYQHLFGAKRQLDRGEITGEEFLEDVDAAFQNSGVERVLGEKGFKVSLQPEDIGREETFDFCMEWDMEKLKGELSKEKRLLRQYENLIGVSKDFILQSGPVLYETLSASKENRESACAEKIEELRKVLEASECFVLFADDQEIEDDQSLLLNYADDLPDAVELPGLYTRNEEGKYLLVGSHTGTRRV